jgi:hypothetical protein
MTQAYVSNRQRVEALLFPQMLWAVVEAAQLLVSKATEE